MGCLMLSGGRDSRPNPRSDSEGEPRDGDRHESLEGVRLAEPCGAVRGGAGVNLRHSLLLSRADVEFPWLPGLISASRAGLAAPRSAGAGVGGPKRRGALLFTGDLLRGAIDVLPARSRLPNPLLGELLCPWPKRRQPEFEPLSPGLATSRPLAVEFRPLRAG
jgi:hypothetical protein